MHTDAEQIYFFFCGALLISFFFVGLCSSLFFVRLYSSFCDTSHLTVRELSFFNGRGGRLFVIAGHQSFLVPPLAYAKIFWSLPFGYREKILVPPLGMKG